MTLKFTGIEVDLDDNTVFRVGRFLIQKKSNSVIKVFLIPTDDNPLDNIEEMDGTLFINSLPAFSISTPELGEQSFIKQSKKGSDDTMYSQCFGDNFTVSVCKSISGGSGSNSSNSLNGVGE